ncbi:MAG TPA: hypothetical protein VIH71_15090 [Solirubrobacteraceae bacterium]
MARRVFFGRPKESLQHDRQRSTTADATPAGTIHERAGTPVSAVQ